MSRLTLILISLCCAALGLLPEPPAHAQAALTVLGDAELRQAFSDLATDDAALRDREIEITNFTAAPATLELPSGAVTYRLVTRHPAKPLGQQTIVVEVLVDGVSQQEVKLSADLKLYGKVVCMASGLRRHSIIGAQDLELVRRDLSSLGPDLITDKTMVIGKELMTTMQPGAVLYGRFVKEPEMVKRGDIVSILAATDSLTITVPGRVQSAGAKGDLIKVKNLMSRKEVYATIIGPNTVQAKF